MRLMTAFQGGESIEAFPSEASVAYQAWVGEGNDVYDEILLIQLMVLCGLGG
jgi:hypothetical protein